MASNVEYDDDDNEYFGWAFDAVTKEWVSANKATKGGAYVCTCPDKHPLDLTPSGDQGVAHKGVVRGSIPVGPIFLARAIVGADSQRHAIYI
jgi:hypothetical protein